MKIKIDDANITGEEPMEVLRVPKLSKAEVVASFQWASFEAGARSFGHTNEVEIRRRFEEWRQSNELDDV